MDARGRQNAPKVDIGRTKKIIRIIWGSLVCVILLLVIVFTLIYNGVIGYMPPIEELKNPTDKYASVIYSSDGEELGRFYKSESNRAYIDFNDISKNVLNALIATEDVRFEEHSGVDARALLRAIIKRGILRQKSAGGGSTITQQLAKQLYSSHPSSSFERLLQKPIEWCIAVKLERFYTKDEILKMYLNQFDFLYNAVGIKSAAYVYFGKEPKDLTIEESAVLVGMLQNPSIYNPRKHPEKALERRNVVIDKMQAANMITEAEAAELQAKPLVIDYHRMDHSEGLAPYFREELRRMMNAKKPVESDYPSWNHQQYITDSYQWENNPLYGWCEKNPKPGGGKWDIYTDGLKIYTTIDSRMQKYAEEAVLEHLGNTLQPAFNAEKRGNKRAPYTSNTSELNNTQYQNLIRKAIRNSDRYRIMKSAGCSEEEIEKAFNTKTDMRMFRYAKDKNGRLTVDEEDMEMTPKDSILYLKSILRAGFMAMDPTNGQVKAYVGGPYFKAFQYDMVSTGRRQVGSTIKPLLYSLAIFNGESPCSQYLCTPVDFGGWSPRGKSTGGMVSLTWALTNSNNLVSARVIDRYGPQKFVDWLKTLGVTTEFTRSQINHTLCLGSGEISLKEMVAAYSTFANQGIRVEPVFVTRICDNNGNEIANFTTKQTEVLSNEAFCKMVTMLRSVVQSGTGRRLSRYIHSDVGGKTGTTNENSDGWFMAINPEIVAGAWVGGEERFIHFANGNIGQGASTALPIFGLFMKKVYADKSLPYSQETRFEFPAGYNPCGDDVNYTGGGEDTSTYEEPEASIADAFED